MNVQRHPKISVDTPAGALVKSSYLERDVLVYGMLEPEAEMLSSLNGQVTIYFSLASAVASVAIGIWINAAFAEKLTSTGDAATHLLAPACLVLSAIFALLGIGIRRTRSTMWERIKRQSRPI
jgi:hypothetical protein